MRNYLVIFLVIYSILYSIPSIAEVFMYQDSQGQWHGVSTMDEVPQEYRDQVQGVDHVEPVVDPAARKNIEEIEKQDTAERKAASDEKAKEEKQAEEARAQAIKNSDAEVKSFFNSWYTGNLGRKLAGTWEQIDYKIMSVNLFGDGSSAEVVMQATLSNSYGKTITRIYRYNGNRGRDGWSFYCTNCND